MSRMDALANLAYGSAALVPIAMEAPGPSSPAGLDLALASNKQGGERLTSRVTLAADLWTAIAADQWRGAGHLLTHRDTVHGLVPLMRAIIEHSVATLWVLDPKSASDVRWARAALYLYDAVYRDAEIAADLYPKGSPDRKARKAAKKAVRAEIESDFSASSGGLVQLDQRPFQLLGEEIPEVNKQMGRLDPDTRRWQGVYGLLCLQGTHPSYATVATVRESPTGVEFGRSPEEVTWILGGPLRVYLHALRLFAVWSGADLAPIEAHEATVDEVLSNF